MTQGEDLTHINEQGRARMVDVSAKEGTQRVARAAGFVHMGTATLELVRTGGCKKGRTRSTSCTFRSALPSRPSAAVAARRAWRWRP